ncbi:MAG: ATP-dependent helicase UvrD/PcrA [Tenuifilum sp.]|jgi:DNA helicase-2/ATP-dependent DNA helicase PcrA|uniref:ATP-dependent helicase n=1 Tax=Tenuifilum sp. TaxID=2760880 RepID=UPI0024AB2BE6|nr:UvrD-helicase domain-containing protein [Tenuifilum sp.]MDI3527371.1 ATP-dependent helicase UvrD/PcrA [Tenuifilum sp.]
MSNYLDELSEIQREAVTNTEGPSLVIASAGSGKTRVLTYRIAHLLTIGVKPWSIMALTFTNKAAREMKERIAKIVGQETASKLWMGTFHSIFAKILRSEAELLGYDRNFTIYDTTDSKNLITQIIKELKLDAQSYKPGEILSRISLAKNNLITPQAYSQNASIIQQDVRARKGEIHRIYTLYAQRCKKASAMDFDDLLLNTNILFRDFPDVLQKYQERFRYFLVDEYQDTNFSQYLIVKKLSERHRNLCVVGDDAQSIYSFRGAKIENILNFQNDYKDYRLFKLEQNYRSTQTIVNAANSVIAKNEKQIPKIAYSSNEEGEKIKLISAYTDQEEGFLVASEILNIVHQTHCNYSDIAILYRTNAQSRIFEETLRKRNIPYRIYGSLSFYQRKEIKDLLAYIRITVNPNDDEAFRRVVNYPARGIGNTTMGHLQELANQKGQSLWQAVDELNNSPSAIKPAAIKKLENFRNLIVSFQQKIYNQDAYEAVYHIANSSGLISDLKADKSQEGISRLQNIEEMLNGIREFIEGRKAEGYEETVTLVDYLENVALLTDQDTDKDEDNNRVSVMTVHSAKGLEFDYVFLTGLEENLFPSTMSISSAEDIEEERRLFYVALTRAAKKAFISYAQTRFRWGTSTNCSPSRFIKEIDPQYIEASFDENQWESSSPQNTRQNFTQRSYYNKPSTQNVASTNPKANSATISTPPKNLKDIALADIRIGMKVYHAKFGDGIVENIEGDGPNRKAMVNFRMAGSKNLLLKFANLKKVD